MKILIVSNMYPSIKKPYWGTFVKVQTSELEKAGCDVYVVSDQGINNVLFKYLSIYLKTIYFGLKIRPDLIHVHYIYPTSLAAILLKKMLGCPLVITSHRCDAFDMPYRNKINMFLTKYCLKCADLIVAVSSEIQKKIKSDLGCSNKKIYVLDMGVNLLNSDLVKIQSSNIKRNRLLFIGLSFKRKGGYDLLDAINYLPPEVISDLTVTFVGEFPDDARKFIRKNHLESVVKPLGRMPHEDIPKIISQHNVFVLASYSEGLPIAMLEAMSQGLCVISTPVGDIESVLSDGSGIIVPVGDSRALANALADLLNNEEKKEEISKMAIQRARSFSSKDRAKKLIDMYRGLLI